MTDTSKPNNVREDKERERRRNKYRYALVEWEYMDSWDGYPKYGIESKKVLATWWTNSHKVLCDDQPERVLKAMLKLMEEDKDG